MSFAPTICKPNSHEVVQYIATCLVYISNIHISVFSDILASNRWTKFFFLNIFVGQSINELLLHYPRETPCLCRHPCFRNEVNQNARLVVTALVSKPFSK